MTGPVVGAQLSAVLGAVLVALLAARWRPPPRRVRRVISEAVMPAHQSRVGRQLRWLGRAVVAFVAVAVWPPGAVLVVGWWSVAPRVRATRARRRRAAEVARALPDVIDLLVLLVGSGLTVPLAVAMLGEVVPAPLGPGFAAVARRRERGQPLADALSTLPERFGPALRSLTSALVATERYGVALGPTLDQLATEARRERRRLAETAARKLPVRLSFPLVCCVLPAFGLLTVAPLIAGALGSLHV